MAAGGKRRLRRRGRAAAIATLQFQYFVGGGGGGGGYSGGGGGQGSNFGAETPGGIDNYFGGGGGGGGSFDGGTNAFFEGNIHAGNGEVDITEVAGSAPAVPEPSTWATMATGFAALGLVGLRRRRKA